MWVRQIIRLRDVLYSDRTEFDTNPKSTVTPTCRPQRIILHSMKHTNVALWRGGGRVAKLHMYS